jgi:hypothetical protein
VEDQRRAFLAFEELETRRAWRDRQLMAFSAQRRKDDQR